MARLLPGGASSFHPQGNAACDSFSAFHCGKSNRMPWVSELGEGRSGCGTQGGGVESRLVQSAWAASAIIC